MAERTTDTLLVDACPNCGARLAGEPSWCPRCLARFDRVDRAAAAREFAAVWGSVKASPAETVSAPPSMYTPYTPPAPPTPAQETPAASSGPAAKNRIPRTVVLAILMGVALQAVTYVLVRALHLQAPTAVALGLGLTIAFYLLVLSLVQGRLFDSNVKPVWHVGPPAVGVAIGVTAGAALAFVVVAGNSALAGHLTSDPTAMMVFAQGGLLRVGALVLISVVCAPFIEELLFRGLLAESLRPKGRGGAIWVSAFAFAAWHLRPELLRYYLFMGALFGLIYWRRGLVSSMSAHATFNGLLTVVAAVAISGAPQTVYGPGVTFTAPASWRQVTASVNGTPSPTPAPAPGNDIELRNPSGAQVFVSSLPGAAPVGSAALVNRFNASPALGPGVTIIGGTVRPVQYPAGQGVAADVNDNGHDAEAVVISGPQGGVILELMTAGNDNARPQFESMLQSLRIG